MGLALQNHESQASLKPEQRRIVQGLLSESIPVGAPIGFLLLPAVFRAQEFYTESPELTAFYAAWQWYATVDFRLSDKRETDLALGLSWLIETNPELLALWKKLNEPYDKLLALPDDGTVATYMGAAESVLGRNFDMAGIKARSAEIQKKLRAGPRKPRLTDEILSRHRILAGDETDGRLPPPTGATIAGRRLSAQQCLSKNSRALLSVRPGFHGRLTGNAVAGGFTSGFGRRALFGKALTKAIEKSGSGSDARFDLGRVNEIAGRIAKSLCAHVCPRHSRASAWADLELWTQLGAWAEQRHTLAHPVGAASNT